MNGTFFKIKKYLPEYSRRDGVTTKGDTVGRQPMPHQVVLGGPLPRFQIVYTP